MISNSATCFRCGRLLNSPDDPDSVSEDNFCHRCDIELVEKADEVEARTGHRPVTMLVPSHEITEIIEAGRDGPWVTMPSDMSDEETLAWFRGTFDGNDEEKY